MNIENSPMRQELAERKRFQTRQIREKSFYEILQNAREKVKEGVQKTLF